ncbi:MAG: hypothetical protein V3T17_00205 [Pseudomonadales bacterium]
MGIVKGLVFGYCGRGVFWLIGLAVVGFGLPGCVEPGVQGVADPVAVAEREARKHRVRVLLANAQQALADDRLMVPKSDNAYGWYQQVLVIDERNPEAHWGMRRITARYLQLAEQAFRSGRVDKAEQMLQRAEKIAATSTQTAALREQYRQSAAANETYLPIRELSARSEKMQLQLTRLATQAQADNSRLLIVARSDAEGRWIYQQMRAAVTGYRLRGNIEIGRVPRVVLIDL